MKRKMKVRAILTLLMLLASTVMFAEGTVSPVELVETDKSGNEMYSGGYTSLAKAMEYVNGRDGDGNNITLTLNEDITLTESTFGADNQNYHLYGLLTVNLNGYTLTLANGDYIKTDDNNSMTVKNGTLIGGLEAYEKLTLDNVVAKVTKLSALTLDMKNGAEVVLMAGFDDQLPLNGTMEAGCKLSADGVSMVNALYTNDSTHSNVLPSYLRTLTAHCMPKGFTVEIVLNEEKDRYYIQIQNNGTPLDEWTLTMPADVKHAFNTNNMIKYSNNADRYVHFCNECGVKADEQGIIDEDDNDVWSVDAIDIYDNSEFNFGVDEFTAESLTIKRTMTNDGWYSLCLPFDVDEATALTMFTRIAEFNKQEGDTYKFNTVSEIEAGIGYIVQVSGPTDGFTFSKVTFVPSETPEDGVFQGVYQPTELEAGCKVIGSGTTVNPVIPGIMKGFRAYFKSQTGNANVRYFSVDDSELTSIECIDMQGDDTTVYDLQGCKVNAAHKGIYIVNGKKLYVK